MDDHASTAQVTHFAAHASWTGVTQDDFAAWLEARRQIVTASKMSALLGVDPWRDAIDVYVEMTMPANDAEPEDREREPLDDPRLWGRELEQPIAQVVARSLGWELFKGGALLTSREHPTIGATLDAEVLETHDGADGLWRVYEGKTVSSWKAHDWNVEDQLPPDHVLIQAQTQLLVTGAPACIIFALVGGNTPKRITILPDEELHGVMIEAVEELMERVRTLDPPPPTMRSEDALLALYPNENGERVELSAEVMEWTREQLELAQQRIAIEKREKELKNCIRAAIGDASFGVLPEPINGKAKEWKFVTRTVPPRMSEGWTKRVLTLVNGPKQANTASTTAGNPRGRRRARRV